MAGALNGMKETNNRKLRESGAGKGAAGAGLWGRPRAKLM